MANNSIVKKDPQNAVKHNNETPHNKPAKLTRKKMRLYTVTEIPETNEYLIEKKATADSPAKSVRIPKKFTDYCSLPPEEFAESRSIVEQFEREKRKVEVYGDSLECHLGYDSLLRVLSKAFNGQVAYYRSEAGGRLEIEEARKMVYRQGISDDEAIKLFENLLSKPTENIHFLHLSELYDNCPSMAENLWEMIKREAQNEFESGHRAAAVFEPVSYMTDAWNRASFLGLRESFCNEWIPNGGIEVSIIDTLAQSWLLFQYWTEEVVRRSQTQPRRENPDFVKWKQWQGNTDVQYWSHGHWDLPTVSEQEAVNHASLIADRFHKMYIRTLRSLRDFRRYAPPVTINNPQQVNIAGEGGQQINVSGNESPERVEAIEVQPIEN